jgi:hypothetical protein
MGTVAVKWLNMPETQRKIDGWKAIAEYLGVAIRTARNHESLGLPIHRLEGGDKPRVFAYKEEIDAWRKGRVMSASGAQPASQPAGGSQTLAAPRSRFAGHLGHAIAATTLYSLLYAEAVFLELAYQFDRFEIVAWNLAGWALLWIAGTTLASLHLACRTQQCEKPASLAGPGLLLVGSALALQIMLSPFLPATPVTQAAIHTYSGQAAYLKDILIYFLPVGLVFMLAPFHFVAAVQRQMSSGRHADVLRLLIGDRRAATPSGAVYLTMRWLVGLVLGAGAASLWLTSHLFDNLKSGSHTNLFMQLAYGRALLWFGLALWCVWWYYRTLNELKRECLAALPASES